MPVMTKEEADSYKEWRDLMREEGVQLFLNSPQFKKERLNEIGRAQAAGFREGQKYPDPKQYANIKEILEALKKKRQAVNRVSQFGMGRHHAFKEAENIIRTHGLEE